MEDEQNQQQSATLPSWTVLHPSDVERSAQLVQLLFSPQSSPEYQQSLQRDLFDLQRKPEAWGLVQPFLQNPDPQVQFFGAHTAQVKVARDWDQFPMDHAAALKSMLLGLTAESALRGSSKVVLRKLYVAVSSLALRLCPLSPSLWPNWIGDTLLALSAGQPSECLADFLCIAIEEVRSADLIGLNKIRITASVKEIMPFALQLVGNRLALQPLEPTSVRLSWLKALEAWIEWGIPADNLILMVNLLIPLLQMPDTFVATAEVLMDILTKSSMQGGAGTKVLTEPLLEFIENNGPTIVQESLNTGSTDETSHAFCKLLMAVGEHSASYVVQHITEPRVLAYLRTVLGYGGLPGWYGVDEEESEMTLSFWYLLQEAIMDGDFANGEDDVKWKTSKLVFAEAAATLVRKARWPRADEGLGDWRKDQKDKFLTYRRDLGDTLVNVFYILRNEFFEPLVPHLLQVLQPLQPGSIPEGGWEGVEAILFCIKSIQEAVPNGENAHLVQIFGPNILGRLPVQGVEQVRKTALSMIGSYTTWFTKEDSTLLLGAISYVVQAFSEPPLVLHAARSLRDLCENNRKTLSSHIQAFGGLYANLSSIPDSEKPKVLQAICSVIQALPPGEAISPIEDIVTPLVARLSGALNLVTQSPEAARAVSIAQLHVLSGCAKGLTNNVDPLQEESIPAELEEETLRVLEETRQDPRLISLRSSILDCVGKAMAIWSSDPETSDALSDLIKSITALPADNTLLSLEPSPVLELVCAAAQRQTTAVWLNLSMILVTQLDTPTFGEARGIDVEEAKKIVGRATQLLVQSTLVALGVPQAMEENPDIVRAFFAFMQAVSRRFVGSIVALPQHSSDSLFQCAIHGLSLPERYSLVDSAKFLLVFGQASFGSGEYVDAAKVLFLRHGYAMLTALLVGIGGAAPRSSIQNLAEILQFLSSKVPECRAWMQEIVYSDKFNHPRLTDAAKQKFLKVATSSRSTRATAEAANEFALVSRGLDNSSFGYASSTTINSNVTL